MRIGEFEKAKIRDNVDRIVPLSLVSGGEAETVRLGELAISFSIVQKMHGLKWLAKHVSRVRGGTGLAT